MLYLMQYKFIRALVSFLHVMGRPLLVLFFLSAEEKPGGQGEERAV